MVYDAGTAAMAVIPDFKGVEAAIRKQATQWGITAGQAFGKAFNAKVREELSHIPTPSPAQTRKQGAESAGGFADGFRKRVEAALKNLPPVEIGAATTEAEQKLRDLRAQLQALSNQRIGVDVDATAAVAEVERIQHELDELARSSPDVQVRADTMAAAAQLSAVTAQVEKLSRSDVDIDVDVDTGAAVAGLAAVGAMSSNSRSHLSALGIAGAGLAPLIVPAAGAAAAAVAAIGTAALAGVAGIGVAALGFMGVADAVKAMGDAQRDAAKSSAQLTQRQSQMAGATDQVRSAERALANTRASSADAARRAAAQVADAERGVARAQETARQATLDLVRAREEERRANQDLAFDLEGVGIAQRRANLDLADAKKELDRVLSNPRATEAQKEAARVAYEEIDLRVRELAVQQQRLSAEQTKAARTGVEGSNRVQAAQQRVRDTTEGVAEAQRALAEAIVGQQEQQRQAAFALVNAQQSVIAAQRSLEQATVSAGTAGSASLDKLNQAMGALSPAGQRFARFIFGLKDELRGLQGAAATGMLPGVQSGIERLLPYLPRVEVFVGRIATALGGLADRATTALTGPAWASFFAFVDRTAVPALEDMVVGTGNVILGFSNLVTAFEPLSGDLSKGLLGLTERFADWSATVGDSAGFREFLAYVRQTGPVLLKFFGDLLIITGKLLVALAPLGAVMLTGLGWIADFLAALDPGVLLYIATGIAGVTAGLIFMATGPVAAIAAIVAAVVGFVGVVVYAYNRVDWFRTAVDATFQAIAVSAVWLWREVFVPAWNGIAASAIWAWDNVLKPTWDALVFLIRNVLAPTFVWLWRNIITPVWQGISLAIDVASAAIRVYLGVMQIFIRTVLAPVFTWLYNSVIKPVWTGIQLTIAAVWQNGIRPVFNALGGFIKDHVVPAFRAGVDAIGKAWEKIRDVAKIPVRFVVDTVLNRAIIDNYNKIAKTFGVDTVDRVPLPAGFASGGILPGYTPGKDVHVFRSPTAGALALSGGEAIIRPEGTRALGADWVAGINSAAQTGGVGGVQRWLGGFADGGILGALGNAASKARRLAGDAITGVKDLLTDPVGALRRLVEKVIGLTPGGSSDFGRLMTSVPKRVLGGALDKVKGIFGQDNDGATGGTGNVLGGSAGMMRILQAQFPGLGLISGYRPGSVTLSGNRSYHASNRAVDVAPNRAVAEWIDQTWGQNTKELITPFQEFNLLNGRRHTYTGAVWNQHNFAGGNAHVHWAYDQGGMLPPGISTVYNGTGKPEPVLTSAQWQMLRQATTHAEPQAVAKQYNFQFADTTLTPSRLRAMQDREDALALADRQV